MNEILKNLITASPFAALLFVLFVMERKRADQKEAEYKDVMDKRVGEVREMFTEVMKLSSEQNRTLNGMVALFREQVSSLEDEE